MERKYNSVNHLEHLNTTIGQNFHLNLIQDEQFEKKLSDFYSDADRVEMTAIQSRENNNRLYAEFQVDQIPK